MSSVFKALLHPRTQLARRRNHKEKLRRLDRVQLSASDILRGLQDLGAMDAKALIVHSSLSSCGRIEGGARTVIDALRTWAGEATIALPTHSYCYPVHGNPAPRFDPATSPSLVGAITNTFRTEPGVLRSRHPSHSLACAGPLAIEICRDHEWCETPCGRGSPYAKLLKHRAAALMFGATFDAYTFFHTAEDAAGCSYLYYPETSLLRFRDASGIEWKVPSRRQDMTVPRRFGAMDRWLEQRGLMRRCVLGLGELLFVPDAGEAHEQLVSAIRRDPGLLLAGHS